MADHKVLEQVSRQTSNIVKYYLSNSDIGVIAGKFEQTTTQIKQSKPAWSEANGGISHQGNPPK